MQASDVTRIVSAVRSIDGRETPLSVERERAALIQEILNTDRRIYRAIQAGSSDEWLRVELTMRQLKILLLLYTTETQAARMSALAAALGVTLPTITGIVDRLVEQSLVQREEEPSDRRLVVARLTPEGRELVERLQDHGRSHLAATLHRLSLEELRTVARALDLLLTAALDESSPGGQATARPATTELSRRSALPHGRANPEVGEVDLRASRIDGGLRNP